jgi:hypothetical protein
MDRERYKQHVVSVSFVIWTMGVMDYVYGEPWPDQGPIAFYKGRPEVGWQYARTLCQLAEAMFPLRVLIKKKLLSDDNALWNYANVCCMGCPSFAAASWSASLGGFSADELLDAGIVSRSIETLAHVMDLNPYPKLHFIPNTLANSSWFHMTFPQSTFDKMRFNNALLYLCAMGTLDMMIVLHARYAFTAADFMPNGASFRGAIVATCTSDEQLPILQWIVDTFGIKYDVLEIIETKSHMVQACVANICPNILVWLETRFGIADILNVVKTQIGALLCKECFNPFMTILFDRGYIHNIMPTSGDILQNVQKMILVCLIAYNIQMAEVITIKFGFNQMSFDEKSEMITMQLLKNNKFTELSWFIAKSANAMVRYMFQDNAEVELERLHINGANLDQVGWLFESLASCSSEAEDIIQTLIDAMPDDKLYDRVALRTAMDKGCHQRLFTGIDTSTASFQPTFRRKQRSRRKRPFMF